MFIKRPFLLGIFILLLTSTGCSLLFPPNNPPNISPPTVTPVTIATQAPATPTSAQIPVATAIHIGPTAIPVGPTQSPAVVVVTATPPPSVPTPHGDGNCTYVATFLGDITIPDNTDITAGSAFVKTWRVRNDGTCTWGTAGYRLHSLVFVGGDKFSAPDSLQLPAGEIRQGNTVDISVPMVAPATAGLYKSQWMLQVDDGPRVGVGPGGTTPLFAQIVVTGSAPPPSGATRVTFAPGATNASVEGNLQAGQSKDYVLNVQQGQFMMLDVGSNNPVSAAVFGVHGVSPLLQPSAPNTWRYQIPATDDYIIRLTAGTLSSNYSLNITIPQRITFAPGAISATINGTNTDHRTVTYVLRASAGQTMGVTITAPANTVGLTIYGLTDGQPLVRYVSGATSWTGKLPLTQDYVIEVVPALDTPINFTLQVIVQ